MAKERLSRQPAAEITVPLLNVDIRLTRPELEQLAQPILDQTVRVTSGVMRWARLPEGRLAGVFLVGGSSRIPLMATLLHRTLGEPPVAIDQPELVVADGSLIADAGALPAAAGPAPGPNTGVMPAIRLTPDGGYESLAPAPASGGAGGPAPSSGAPTPVPPLSGSIPVSGGVPVSAAPSSGPSGDVRSGGHPVSGVPGESHPVSGAPGNPAYAVGRVIVPGAHGPGPAPASNPNAIAPTRPMPQPDLEPPTGPAGPYPPRPAAPAAGYQSSPNHQSPASFPAAHYPPVRQPPAEPSYAEPSYASSSYVDDQPATRGRSPAVRALVYVLVAVLLAAVPVITGYLAYKFTTGEPPLPIKLLLVE
jgi:Hsp70 protein